MATDKDPPCQSCTADPNYAIICSFFEKFSAKCGISHFNFLELQEMLEDTVEVRQPLADLHIKLLRKARKSCTADKWERVVTRFCHSYSKQDGWELERFGYKNSRIEVKLRLLKHLLEAQFDFNPKFKSEVNKLSATELRVEPLGRDQNGQTYWCQFDPSCNIRIYKEDPDEESWDLIAQDRKGLVGLIDDLSSGEGQKELNSILNEDSNSQEIDKPIVDTGQLSTGASPPELDGNLSQEVKQYSDSTNSSADIVTPSAGEAAVNGDSDSNSRHPDLVNGKGVKEENLGKVASITDKTAQEKKIEVDSTAIAKSEVEVSEIHSNKVPNLHNVESTPDQTNVPIKVSASSAPEDEIVKKSKQVETVKTAKNEVTIVKTPKEEVAINKPKEEDKILKKLEEVGIVKKARDEVKIVKKPEEIEIVKKPREEIEIVKKLRDEVEIVKKSKEEVEIVKKSREEVEIVKKPREEVETVKKPREEVEIVKKPRDEVEIVKKPREEIEIVKKSREEVEIVKKPRDEVEIVRKPREEVEIVKKSRDEVEIVRKPREEGILKKTREEVEIVKKPRDELKMVKVPKDSAHFETKSKEILLETSIEEKVKEVSKQRLASEDNAKQPQVVFTKLPASKPAEISEVVIKPVPLNIPVFDNRCKIDIKSNDNVLNTRIDNASTSQSVKVPNSVGRDLSVKPVKKVIEVNVSDIGKVLSTVKSKNVVPSLTISSKEEDRSNTVSSSNQNSDVFGSDKLGKIHNLVESVKNIGGVNRVSISKKLKGPPGSKLDEIFKFKRVHDPTTPTNLPPQSQPIPAYIGPGVKDSVFAHMKDGIGPNEEKREVSITKVVTEKNQPQPERMASRLEERLGEISQRLGMRQVEIKPIKSGPAECMQAEDLTKPKSIRPEEVMEPYAKKVKLERVEELSEAVEEPLMLVTGEGSGADCNSVNPMQSLKLLKSSNFTSIAEPEFSEAIEEPIMFFFGEGSGFECNTGNPELEKNAHGSQDKVLENEERTNEAGPDKSHKLWSIETMCDKDKEQNCENSSENQFFFGPGSLKDSEKIDKPPGIKQEISSNNSVDKNDCDKTGECMSDQIDSDHNELVEKDKCKKLTEEAAEVCSVEELKTDISDKIDNNENKNSNCNTLSTEDLNSDATTEVSSDKKKEDVVVQESKNNKDILNTEIKKEEEIKEEVDSSGVKEEIETSAADTLEDGKVKSNAEICVKIDSKGTIDIDSKAEIKVEKNNAKNNELSEEASTQNNEDLKEEKVEELKPEELKEDLKVTTKKKDNKKAKDLTKEKEVENALNDNKIEKVDRVSRSRRSSKADKDKDETKKEIVEEVVEVRRPRRSAAVIATQLSENIIKAGCKKPPSQQVKGKNDKDTPIVKNQKEVKQVEDNKVNKKQPVKAASKAKITPPTRTSLRKSSVQNETSQNEVLQEAEKLEDNKPEEDEESNKKMLGLNSFSFDVDASGNVPMPVIPSKKRKLDCSKTEGEKEDVGNDEEPISVKKKKAKGGSSARSRRSKGGKSTPKKKVQEVVGSGEDETEDNITPTKQDEDDDKPKQKKPSIKSRTLLGLTPQDLIGVDTGNTELSACGRSVRTSRRIAQIKIKEQEEERKMHEQTMKEINNAREREKQIKKNKTIDKSYKPRSEPKEKDPKKPSKKKSKGKTSDGDFTPNEQDSNDTVKKKKGRPRKKTDRLKYDHNNPWKSSSGSGTSEEENDDLEHYDMEDDEEEEDLRTKELKSDHEFSPESDLEGDESSGQPVRHARTALKGSVEDKVEDDDTACHKCGKSDHPEWILLCDKCDHGWHGSCLRPALMIVPEGDWFCPPCQHLQLVEKLKDTLRIFEKDSKRRENDELRRKRLAYVGISLSNVLPPPGTKVKFDDSSSSSAESSRSDDSRSESSSESSSYEDEPVYQLRVRRQTNQSYRFNDYDQLINSAIQDEMEAVAGAGNQGRGKDIENIVQAEKQEANGHGPSSKQEQEEEGGDDWRPSIGAGHGGRKKSRKLTNIDVSSEDDKDSDEDFKGSSSEEEEEESHSGYSSGSDYGRSRHKSQPVRRSTRARRSRVDREFINDDSEDSEAPRKKKSRKVFSESESSESDETWGARKKKTTAKTTRRRKKSRFSDSDSDPRPRRKSKNKKSKVKYGLSEDEDYGSRRTRGKKINYQESDSEEQQNTTPQVVKTRRVIESDDEDDYKPEPTEVKKNILSDSDEDEDSEEADEDYDDKDDDKSSSESKENEKQVDRKPAEEKQNSEEDKNEDPLIVKPQEDVKASEPVVNNIVKPPSITSAEPAAVKEIIAKDKQDEIVKEKPVEIVKDTQLEIVKDKPVEIVKDKPVEIIKEKPAEKDKVESDVEMFVGDVEEEDDESEEEQEEMEEDLDEKESSVKLKIPSPINPIINKPEISLTIKPANALKSVKDKIVEEELNDELISVPGPTPKAIPVPVPPSEVKESVKEVEKLGDKEEKKPDPPKVNTIRIVPQHKLMANPPPQLEVKSMMMRPRVGGSPGVANFPGMRYPPRPHMIRGPPQYPSQYPSQYLPYYSHHFPEEYPSGYCPNPSVAPPQQMPPSASYPHPEEGEFGGLVSYFSSQHEDNLDS